MLHIGLVIDDMGVHGAIRRVVELGNALTSRGHWVTIYTAEGKPCEWLPQLAEADTFDGLMKAHLDVLVYSAGMGEAFRAAAEAHAKTRIFYILSVPTLSVLDKPSDIYTRRVVSMLRSPDWIIAAVSSGMLETLCRVRPDTKLLLGGINRTIFHHYKIRRDKSTKIVLSSGDHRAREGSGEAYAAVEMVKEKMAVEWKSYFKLGYSQRQLAECYSGADVFLDAQWYAGWNNAVAEAMACGTPVVCTDILGTRDLAQNEVTALVVPVSDVPAMAAAVTRILTDMELRTRLVKNALEHVKQFAYAKMAERLEGIVNGSV